MVFTHLCAQDSVQHSAWHPAGAQYVLNKWNNPSFILPSLSLQIYFTCWSISMQRLEMLLSSTLQEASAQSRRLVASMENNEHIESLDVKQGPDPSLHHFQCSGTEHILTLGWSPRNNCFFSLKLLLCLLGKSLKWLQSPGCLITCPLIGAIAHQTPEPECIQEGPSTASVTEVSGKQLWSGSANVKQQTWLKARKWDLWGKDEAICLIYCGGEQIAMWKSVEIFYKKDSNAQLNAARMGGEGHELPHQGLWPDVGRKNFVLSGSCSTKHQLSLPE